MGGWRLVLWTFLLVGAATLAAWLTGGVDAALRLTARTSLLLFSLTFAARAASRLFAAKWPLRNRRYLGVSFAVSHGFHLVAIAGLALEVGPRRFAGELDLGTWFGVLGYAVIAAMVATSFDRTAAWLGRRRWKLLHASGMYGLAAFFAYTYVGAAARAPTATYLALAAVALAAPALRVAAALSRRPRGT